MRVKMIDKNRYNVMPCPFCGSEKIMMASDCNPPLIKMYAYCESCGARGKNMKVPDTLINGGITDGVFEIALFKWNTRTSKRFVKRGGDYV